MIRAGIVAVLLAGQAHASISVVAVVDGAWVSGERCMRPRGAAPYPVPAPPVVRAARPARGPEIACVEWADDRCVRRSIQMEWRAK